MTIFLLLSRGRSQLLRSHETAECERISTFDVPSADGARLAVEEANAKGGVLGRPVTLLVEDGESDPEVVKRKTDLIYLAGEETGEILEAIKLVKDFVPEKVPAP